MFTRDGERYCVAIGLDGGVYVCRYRPYWQCWQIVGSEDQ